MRFLRYWTEPDSTIWLWTANVLSIGVAIFVWSNSISVDIFREWLSLIARSSSGLLVVLSLTIPLGVAAQRSFEEVRERDLADRIDAATSTSSDGTEYLDVHAVPVQLGFAALAAIMIFSALGWIEKAWPGRRPLLLMMSAFAVLSLWLLGWHFHALKYSREQMSDASKTDRRFRLAKTDLEESAA